MRRKNQPSETPKQKERALAKQAALFEKSKNEATRLANLPLTKSILTLGKCLILSKPLYLIFAARYLGQGEHREALADYLREQLRCYLYQGDTSGAKRAQAALSALLQKDRVWLCHCTPVKVPRQCPPDDTRDTHFHLQ